MVPVCIMTRTFLKLSWAYACVSSRSREKSSWKGVMVFAVPSTTFLRGT